MTDTPPTVAGQESYDVYLRFGPLRLTLYNEDHGVTLGDDRISWVAAERSYQAPLREIAEVHLQSGVVGDNTIASCRLNFRDGGTLLLTSSNRLGLQDNEHDRIYTAFALDLHARLAALDNAQAMFTAGFGETRYRFGQAILVIAGLFFLVTPTVLLFMTGAWSMAWTLYLGIGLLWPVYRVVTANAPATYDPRQVPVELLPAQPRPK